MVSWKIFSNFVARKITADIFIWSNSCRISENIFDFQRVDSTNQGLNHYPLNGSIGFESIYVLDSDLLDRQHYPTCKGKGILRRP